MPEKALPVRRSAVEKLRHGVLQITLLITCPDALARFGLRGAGRDVGDEAGGPPGTVFPRDEVSLSRRIVARAAVRQMKTFLVPFVNILL